MKKHLFTLTLSSVLAIPAVSHAEFKGGFADIGIHYLDWTSRTTEKSSTKSHKDDFGYLELEGGANFSWGEMYGFFDWENFYNDRHDKPGSEQRYTFKNTNRIYLGDTGFNLYLHAYGTYGSANRVNSMTICSFTGSATISPAAVGGSNRSLQNAIQTKPIIPAITVMSPVGLQVTALCWAVRNSPSPTGTSTSLIVMPPTRQVMAAKKV